MPTHLSGDRTPPPRLAHISAENRYGKIGIVVGRGHWKKLSLTVEVPADKLSAWKLDQPNLELGFFGLRFLLAVV